MDLLVETLLAGRDRKIASQSLIEQGKKKKAKVKKINKYKIRQVDCGLEPNKYMLLTPGDLFKEINKIA